VNTESFPAIPGVALVYPDKYEDERGFFCVTGDTGAIPQAESWRWCMSRSARGVLRGLHVRSGEGEAKLVRCSAGVVFDVVVDLRKDSPSYRTWASFHLDGERQVSLYIPPGCAHGYQAVTAADVTYHISGEHDPAGDVIIAWDDPELDIPWPVVPAILSGRDKSAMTLAEACGKGLLPL
jgi:dTDP-4-dehydrorhamnose 3,5-epimerase